MGEGSPAAAALRARLPDALLSEQETRDGIPTLWIAPGRIRDVLVWFKHEARPAWPMLYDLSAVDERVQRARPPGKPACDFSLLYQLLSLEGRSEVRLRVPLTGEYPRAASIVDLWPCANWYEREAYDMFGIVFEGHPFLRRILMPDYWQGHPLRKEHPARRTDMEPYRLGATAEQADWERFELHPEEYGSGNGAPEVDAQAAREIYDLPPDGGRIMYLNFGPHHPGTHGIIRFVLKLDGERIRDIGIQIGFHHRAQEKLAERQSFHTYVPYPDRIDYLAGVQNEFPYVLAAEKLAGIEVPPRAQIIRVMLAEFFRIANHLVWFGTLGADLGSMSPVFYTFNDRERIFEVTVAITGFRMHPGWFRIGGVADDLPNGWEKLVKSFLGYFPGRLKEYRRALLKNSILKQRTKGIGIYTTENAVEWGVTGPNLRATGLPWDLRKVRPYSMYDQFQFEVPTATAGDSYARAVVRVDEMEQSLRIIEQAARDMPGGSYKSEHEKAIPPRKAETMLHIETLINHFLGVSWGKPMPVGEAQATIEAPKGNMSFYLLSDGNVSAYRSRVRTPTFPIMQTVPWLSRDLLVSDLITILGSIDYVMGDIDR